MIEDPARQEQIDEIETLAMITFAEYPFFQSVPNASVPEDQ